MSFRTWSFHKAYIIQTNLPSPFSSSLSFKDYMFYVSGPLQRDLRPPPVIARVSSPHGRPVRAAPVHEHLDGAGRQARQLVPEGQAQVSGARQLVKRQD